MKSASQKPELEQGSKPKSENGLKSLPMPERLKKWAHLRTASAKPWNASQSKSERRCRACQHGKGMEGNN